MRSTRIFHCTDPFRRRPHSDRGFDEELMTWQDILNGFRAEADIMRAGGGPQAVQRQHKKNRLTARERIEQLTDEHSEWLEVGLWRGWRMYMEVGGANGASVVCGVGQVCGRSVMIIANDATIKAGAFFPETVKKVLRAQRIAMDNYLPLIYLVDSAGVFLPMQDEIFPDEDDFGRIFRNNAVISAMGIPQIAAIMGNCVAGGGYLPVLCDKLRDDGRLGTLSGRPSAGQKRDWSGGLARGSRRRLDACRDQRHDRFPRKD